MIEKTEIGLKFSNTNGDILHFYNDNSIFISNPADKLGGPTFAGFDFSEDEIDALRDWLVGEDG